MDKAIGITGSWNRLQILSTMVSSILVPLAILHLISIQDASGHGALIEPPMRSVLWKYGFDTPINYNYMELYCGGFQNFLNNGGRCGVCGDPLQGPYENERGGKYDLGVIARSYPEGTNSIEVKVEITAHHKGYFAFKLCPNNEADATQECLDRLPLMIEEGIQQGNPMKFYPPEGQGVYSIEVFIPPNIRCARCVLQWTYRSGNAWGNNTDGKSCLGCGVQETFINCADISIGSHSTIFNTYFKIADSLPVLDQTPNLPAHNHEIGRTSALNHTFNGIDDKRPSISVHGMRGQLSVQMPPEPQHPLKLKPLHSDIREPIQGNVDATNSIGQQKVIVSETLANDNAPVDIIQSEKEVVSADSVKIFEEFTSDTSFPGENKDSLKPIQERRSSLQRGQYNNHQENNRKQNKLENNLASFPRNKEVVHSASGKDEMESGTMIGVLQDKLKTFKPSSVRLVRNYIPSNAQFPNHIDFQINSTGWTTLKSVLRPLRSQRISNNFTDHPSIAFMEASHEFLHNNAANETLHDSSHPTVPQNDTILHTREGVVQAQLHLLPVQRIADSRSQMGTPILNTAQRIALMQNPLHQGQSLVGQQQLQSFSNINAHIFPAKEVRTQSFGMPQQIITEVSPNVQARMALTSPQIRKFYQKLAFVESINNAHHLNLQHVWQTPIDRDRATLAAVHSLPRVVPDMIHREALIRNVILTERQLKMDRRLWYGV